MAPPPVLHPSIWPLATRLSKRQARSFIRQVSVWSDNLLCGSEGDYWIVLFASFWNGLPIKIEKRSLWCYWEQYLMQLELLLPHTCKQLWYLKDPCDTELLISWSNPFWAINFTRLIHPHWMENQIALEWNDQQLFVLQYMHAAK